MDHRACLDEDEDAHLASGLVRADGTRPSDAEINAVHKDGRCFDDEDAPSLQQQYRAQTATHYDFEAFDADLNMHDDVREAYDRGRGHQRRSELRVGVGFGADGTRVDTMDHSARAPEGLDLQPTHEECVERCPKEMDMGFVKAPACQARGQPPHHVKCFQCGKGDGWELQMPSDVFETAWRSNAIVSSRKRRTRRLRLLAFACVELDARVCLRLLASNS